VARRELESLKGRSERLENLKHDRDAVLEAYANVTGEALEELSPEERNKLYKILKLRIALRDDGTLEVSGVFCGDLELPRVEAFAERNAMVAALSTKTCNSTRVRPSQLSARSSAASISAVPTPLPCQSSRTTIPRVAP
jgi:hypothetical protein